MLLRYLIVSIDDLKAQIVAYKEQVIKDLHNTLLDYINKAGRLGESTTNRLINITNEIGFTRGDINAINDKVTYIAAIVDCIDDNTTPKTKIKAKNSSKKSE